MQKNAGGTKSGQVQKMTIIVGLFAFHIMLFKFIRVTALLFLIIFNCKISANARISKADSLERLLRSHKAQDTVKVNILNKIAYTVYLSDIERTKRYAKESYSLSKKLNYSKGEAESLWLQGIALINKEPDVAMTYFSEALKLAERLGYKYGAGKYTNAIGTVYGATGRDSLAIEYYQKALTIAKESKDLLEMGKSLVNLSQAYNRMGRVESAINGYTEALKAYRAVDEKHGMAICYNSLGNIYTTQGNYPIALESFQNGLKINEERQEMKAVSKSLVSIGSIYFAQKEYSKALEYNQRVVKIAESTNDKHALAGSLLNIGLIYLQTDNQQALEYFHKALYISKDLKIISLQISLLLNIGKLYYKDSNTVKALDSFNEALAIAEARGIKSSVSNAKHQIANIYYDKKEYSKATEYSLESLEIAKDHKLIETEKELHGLLSEIYAATKNYKSAYIHSQLFKQLSDKIFNESNIRQITELEYTYNFERDKQALILEQQKREAIQIAERRQQSIIIVILAISSVLASTLAIYILRLYRFKNRANKAMQEFEQEKKRMLEQEIERINLELEQNHKSLAATSLKLIQNSERNADMLRRLEELTESVTPESKRALQGLVSDFKRASRTSNWSEFELLFQKVHNSFYEKLNENFPDLTANERKLCAFLKLNMSSKDIANITFQSEEALKKARQRLRQKLGIERDTNLSAFLQNIELF